MKSTWTITGLHCGSCKLLIEDVCSEFPEIHSAEVNVDAKTLTVDHAETLDLTKVEQAIQALGEYQLSRV